MSLRVCASLLRTSFPAHKLMADKESTRMMISILVICVRRRFERRVRMAASSKAVEDGSGPDCGMSVYSCSKASTIAQEPTGPH